MDTEGIVPDIVKVVLQGNELIKRQAEERQVLLKRIMKILQKENEKNDPSDILQDLGDSIPEKESSQYYNTIRLSYLNTTMSELDHLEKYREDLIDEILRMDANLLSRDELIEILEEYIEMEQATIHRLVSDYAEAQDVLENLRSKMKILEIMSKRDPRFKALQILKNHHEGISITQLSFMLNTTQFLAGKIIKELEEMNLVERKDSLLKVTEQIDVAVPDQIMTNNQLLSINRSS